MSEIKDLKATELMEMTDFVQFIEEYGHIFHGKPEELNEPFKKIMEGIGEVRKLVDYYYSY